MEENREEKKCAIVRFLHGVFRASSVDCRDVNIVLKMAPPLGGGTPLEAWSSVSTRPYVERGIRVDPHGILRTDEIRFRTRAGGTDRDLVQYGDIDALADRVLSLSVDYAIETAPISSRPPGPSARFELIAWARYATMATHAFTVAADPALRISALAAATASASRTVPIALPTSTTTAPGNPSFAAHVAAESARPYRGYRFLSWPNEHEGSGLRAILAGLQFRARPRESSSYSRDPIDVPSATAWIDVVLAGVASARQGGVGLAAGLGEHWWPSAEAGLRRLREMDALPSNDHRIGAYIEGAEVQQACRWIEHVLGSTPSTRARAVDPTPSIALSTSTTTAPGNPSFAAHVAAESARAPRDGVDPAIMPWPSERARGGLRAILAALALGIGTGGAIAYVDRPYDVDYAMAWVDVVLAGAVAAGKRGVRPESMGEHWPGSMAELGLCRIKEMNALLEDDPRVAMYIGGLAVKEAHAWIANVLKHAPSEGTPQDPGGVSSSELSDEDAVKKREIVTFLITDAVDRWSNAAIRISLVGGNLVGGNLVGAPGTNGPVLETWEPMVRDAEFYRAGQMSASDRPWGIKFRRVDGPGPAQYANVGALADRVLTRSIDYASYASRLPQMKLAKVAVRFGLCVQRLGGETKAHTFTMESRSPASSSSSMDPTAPEGTPSASGTIDWARGPVDRFAGARETATYDGETLAELLRRDEENRTERPNRALGGGRMEHVHVRLTPLQRAAVAASWTAELGRKVQAGAADDARRERDRVRVDLDVDDDGSGWRGTAG